MKKTMYSAIIMALFFMSCGSKTTETTSHHNDETHHHEDGETHEHQNKNETSIMSTQNASINDLFKGYLNIKNALVHDDSKNAATAGAELYSIISNIDRSSFSDTQNKVYDEVADDALENAKHIGDNGGKVDHQREHFAMLSKDINDLLNAFTSDQKLYQDFCPMYEDGNGAIWISETKDIKNPYYGSKMLSCGKMRKEW